MARGGKHNRFNGKKIKIKKQPSKPIPPIQDQRNNLEIIYQRIMAEVQAALKDFELRQKMILSDLVEKYEVLRANVVTTQTVLAEQQIINREEFIKKVDEYLMDVVGIVDHLGRMRGYVQVDTYRIGVKPKPTSVISEHIGGGPKIIMRG